jgi:hypothetical protein
MSNTIGTSRIELLRYEFSILECLHDYVFEYLFEAQMRDEIIEDMLDATRDDFSLEIDLINIKIQVELLSPDVIYNINQLTRRRIKNSILEMQRSGLTTYEISFIYDLVAYYLRQPTPIIYDEKLITGEISN